MWVRRTTIIRRGGLALLLLASGWVQADPWLAPGNLALRHDIELLADAGIIRGPVMTWPMSWPDISRDVLAAADTAQGDPSIDKALARVKRAARAAQQDGPGGLELRAAGSSDAPEWRAFSDQPREQGEVSVASSWMTERFAARVQVTGVASPTDDKSVRLDGSYVGVNVGNFMISAGGMERWWGPGWDGSLILGTNARPIPSLTVERNYTDPFKSRWLRWIGPWRASIAVGQAEGATTARDGRLPVLPDVRFLAARVNFKPRPWMEFALTRSAQFCGQGRDCSLTTIKDLLLGRDNQIVNGNTSTQPGNQMAGYDLRIRAPWTRIPARVYVQAIGEDEANGLPSKFLGVMGAEAWGSMALGSWRLRAEFTDTACVFTRQNPEFNCSYRNSLFPQGYSYRGRMIGHGLDNDSRMASIGAVLVRPSGDSWSIVLRDARINRGGRVPDLAHALSAGPSKLRNADLEYHHGFTAGDIRVGVALDDYSGARTDSSTRGFIEWRQRF